MRRRTAEVQPFSSLNWRRWVAFSKSVRIKTNSYNQLRNSTTGCIGSM